MLLTALFSACSSDDPVPGTGQEDPVDDGGKVYMNIDITSTTANGSRSTTTDPDDPNVSSDDTEVGKDYENKISNIMVVLVGEGKDASNNTVDQCVIAKWSKDFSSDMLNIENPNTITAEFNATDLTNHYKQHGSTPATDLVKARVYVICNYDGNLTNSVVLSQISAAGAASTVNWITGNKATDGTYPGVISNVKADGTRISFSKENKILMTNYKVYSTEIPSQADITANKFNSPTSAFSLTPNGPVLVERAVARFDYIPYLKVGGSNLYKDAEDKPYYKLAEKIDGKQPEIHARLLRMALVNESKNFYLFRRVSDDGTNREKNNKDQDNNLSIGGREVDNGDPDNRYVNFVVDPEWSWKQNPGTAIQKSDYTQRFHYWVHDYETDDQGNYTSTAWSGQSIASVTVNDNKIDDAGYYKWLYVTPNTIPGVSTQQAGVSTGIIFKAKIEANDENIGVGRKMKDQYDIFAYNGTLIGSWADVRDLATAGTDADVTGAYNRAVAADNSLSTWAETSKTLTPTQTQAAVKEAGFAKYGYVNDGGEGAGGGYFCYYYYWNRHNDNSNSGEMGPMEFGVVRNNVYKLAVTSITRLGHPFRDKNDPDPVDPKDPDEESKLFMKVSVKVMPWTKRVNHIVF